MASLTAAASSPANMLGQLAAWLPTVSGWTLVDAISATDQVFLFSDGDTKVPVYLRLTSSLMGDTPGIAPETAFDNLTFRLYRSWNAVAHTGYGEVGRKNRVYYGPAHAMYATADAYWSPSTNWQYDLYPHTAAQWSTSWQAYGSSNVAYNGRTFFSRYAASINAYEPTFRNAVSIGTVSNYPYPTLVHTIDRASGKEYLWGPNLATAGQCWQRYDVLENLTEYRADPPWGAYKPSVTALHSWDGDDLIYMAKSDAAGSAFARYRISSNSWESLAAMPSLGAWTMTAAHTVAIAKMLYLPAALTGFAQDYIYTCDYVNAASNTQWARYGVTDNVWETGPTAALPAVPAGTNTGNPRQFYFDPSLGARGSICFAHGSNTNSLAFTHFHIFDLDTEAWSTAVMPPNWRAPSSVWPGSYYNTIAMPQFEQAGSLRLPASSASLSFAAVADAGHVKLIATWWPAAGTKSITSFVYAGFYNSYLKTDRFTLAVPLVSGKAVTITTQEDITGKLVQGDCIEIFDSTAQVQPAWRAQALARGGGETLRITEILGAHSFKAESVNANYPAGAYLGQDIAGAVIGNESMDFLCLRSPKGYAADGIADSYKAYPLFSGSYPPNGDRITSMLEWRSSALLSPLQLMQYTPFLATYGCVGELRGVTTANPRATVNVAEALPDGNYLTFSPYLKDRSNDVRLLQMGPM